ncbi:Sec-independent protein translocase subunit TatA [Candidatus Corynebacterium faecigallinarum]|uniref:Sec-independent protein translocase subunit TatA n=1 Tax=Candidatus Corynebacterium faecigallinarum TaxID=2838528 RepID=UPI003FD1EF1A
MGGVSLWQILIIVLIILLLFGASKLPNLARSVGRSARIFKSEVREMKNDDQPQVEKAPESSAPSEADRIANDFTTDPVEPVDRVDSTKKNDL